MKGRRPFRPSALGAIALAIALWIAAPARAAERLAIVTTTTTWQVSPKRSAATASSVTSLCRRNLMPEDYQPRPQDVARLRNPRAWSCASGSTTTCGSTSCGAGGVDRRQRAQSAAGRRRPCRCFAAASRCSSFAATSVGPTDGHAHGSGNPHYWLDPENAEIITATILEALARDRSRPWRQDLRAPTAWRSSPGSRHVCRHVADARSRRSRACRSSPITTPGPISRAGSGSTSSASSRPKPGVPPSPAHLAALIQTMREPRRARHRARAPRAGARCRLRRRARTGARIATLASIGRRAAGGAATISRCSTPTSTRSRRCAQPRRR